VIGCGVVTALAVCGGAICCLPHHHPRRGSYPTDKLLALVAEGKITEAYKSTAFVSQAQQSEAEFAELMKRSGLTEYKSSLWLNRKIENNQATLEGTVTTRTGTTIPLVVKLVKEGNDWKVLSIQVPQGRRSRSRGDACANGWGWQQGQP
jgi:hypothetical protein